MRRLSIALVAATSTAMGLMSPIASAAELSPACQEQVDKAIADHKAKGGSSFMGPGEMAQGMSSGYGSSGMPDYPDCYYAETDKKDPDNSDDDKDLADWNKRLPANMQSSDGVINAVSIGGVVFTALAALIQAAATIAKVSPDFRNMLRKAAKDAGLKLGK